MRISLNCFDRRLGCDPIVRVVVARQRRGSRIDSIANQRRPRSHSRGVLLIRSTKRGCATLHRARKSAEPMRRNAFIRWVAVAAATAAFVWTMALSVSPGLHERVHAGQRSADHTCAVTFLRTGSCHHTAAPSFSAGADVIQVFADRVELDSHWVPSPFLTAAVFEHAPPSWS